MITGAGARASVGANTNAATFVVRGTVSPGRRKVTLTPHTPAGQAASAAAPDGRLMSIAWSSVLVAMLMVMGAVEQCVRERHVQRRTFEVYAVEPQRLA